MIRIYIVLGFMAFGAFYIINAERNRAEVKTLERYQDERRKTDNADVGEGNADDDRDWLNDASERLRGPR